MFDFIKKMFAGNSEELKELIKNGAVIIDVRSPGEFSGGHANKAINIPLDTLGNNIAKIKKFKKPVVLCCASGMRSSKAKGILVNKGVENVHDAGSWGNLR
ncbi:rhodanese-like domain-containing protein [Arcticibacterium luteifluviistationis]|uniref:Sulfurtransferase n=1 Tax=Arcticibacterium luteifluviistationis TaxID=1784714 RepID=A0A2Z4GD71_9BACT|nr:rhodanese-like domain-containing protein [Arcticibacterium luteifluviistationis]AWV99249.1 sulfurtransferase [Arcticibacterium luteifluviistationis]